MEVEIYREVENIGEVTIFSDVQLQDEGCMPDHHEWCVMSEDEICFDESLYNKAQRIKIEDYILSDEYEIRRELEETFIDIKCS